MREQDILKNFKITSLTLRNIYQKFEGGIIMEQGRVIYNIKDADKNLLACARLDPFTFRQIKGITVLPFHRYMVYKVMTEPKKEDIIADIVSRQFINTNIAEAYLLDYIKHIIECLPKEIRDFIKEGQDLPPEASPILNSVVLLLDLKEFYNVPANLFNLDFIVFDPALKIQMETLLSTRYEYERVAEYLKTAFNTAMNGELVRQYKHVFYDKDLLMSEDWDKYLCLLTVVDRSFKTDAYLQDMVSFLLSNKVYEGIEFTGFLKKALQDQVREYHEIDEAMPLEKARAVEAVLRTIFLIKENIPQEVKANSLLGSVHERMEEQAADSSSQIGRLSEVSRTIK